MRTIGASLAAACCLLLPAGAAAETGRTYISRSEGDDIVWAPGKAEGPTPGAELSDALRASGPRSYIVIPYKMGLLIPAVQDEAFAFSTSDCGGGTYCGNGRYNMAMLGIVRDGECLLATWDGPDVDVTITGDRHSVSATLSPLAPDVTLRLHELGRGDYVSIAKAYRRLRTAASPPDAAADAAEARVRTLDGAIAFKPFAKTGSAVDANPERFPSGRGQAQVHFTFGDIRRIAEHLRRELRIEDALITVAGWMHGGYDVGHPDVLPAAEDCGGDRALATTSARTRTCGYTFGLHDNYDMLYESAPSTDPADALRAPGGALVRFNAWAGGPQYSCCPARQGKYLSRNLAEIVRRYRPGSLFVDQWTALPLYICAADEHPLNRSECIEAYRRLCAAVHQRIPILGSEDGQEWAVGRVDYFEGILTRYELDWGYYIPLFELVYRERAACYTHQGDRLTVGRPESVLNLMAYGRTPIIDLPEGVYFEDAQYAGLGRRNRLSHGATFEVMQAPAAGVARAAIFAHPPWRGTRGCTVGRYRVQLPDVDLLQMDFYVALKDGAGGGGVNFLVRVDGEPLFSKYWDERSWGHHVLDLSKYSGREVGIELVTDPGESTAFDWALWGEPRIIAGDREVYSFVEGAAEADTGWERPDDPFARADNGWADGMHPLDALIKNCAETLGALNRLTAGLEMTSHGFLDERRFVERTTFADGTTVTVNYGVVEHTVGQTVLPQYGFLTESPVMVAFHASSHQGVAYPDGALFAITSPAGIPIDRASRLRVYHGFGTETRVRIARPRLQSGYFEADVRKLEFVTPPRVDVKVWSTE